MPVIGTAGSSGTQGGAPASPNSPIAANTGMPATPVTGSIATMLASPTWRSQVGAYLWGGYAGELGTYGLQGALASTQLGMTPFGLGLTGAQLQTQAGFTFARAMLGYQGLGLQSATLGRQAATAGAQQGLEQGQYALTSQRYPQEAATATLSYRNRQLGLQSNAAATGTLNTSGARNAQQTAAQQYAWQLATIYRQQQISALGQQSEILGYGTKAGALANAQQQLALAAKGQGIDVQQAVSQLGFGLTQLGIKATPLQILTAIGQSQTGAATTLRALLSSGSLIGGLGPGFAQPPQNPQK